MRRHTTFEEAIDDVQIEEEIIKELAADAEVLATRQLAPEPSTMRRCRRRTTFEEAMDDEQMSREP